MRLTVNGLEMPADFPAAPFERMYMHVRASLAGQGLRPLSLSASHGMHWPFEILLVVEGDNFTRPITSPEGAQSLVSYNTKRPRVISFPLRFR